MLTGLVEIITAKHAGFCFGVQRAVQLAMDAARRYGKVYTLGSLIHNSREVERLQQEGVVPVQRLQEVPEGGVVVIRSHGVAPEVLSVCEDRQLTVIDATCPFVSKAQKIAAELTQAGRPVIILGDKSHPEVIGINGWSGGRAYVIANCEQAKALPPLVKPGFLAQTTQQEETWEAVRQVLEARYPDLTCYHTICATTKSRQEEVRQMAKTVDCMIVIGGVDSANTQKLKDICRSCGKPAFALESADQLGPALFYKAARIGVAAGASTPDWIIEEVVGKMEEMEKMEQGLQAEEVVAEPVAQEVAAEEAEPSFEEAYGKDIQDIRRGARVVGTIVQVRDDEILVDIGGKSEGVVPSAELLPEEAADIKGTFKVGQEMEVLILKRENKEGYPVLSKRRVDQDRIWEKLAEMKTEGQTISGKVVEVVKGGVLVDVGVRGFVPASLVDLNFVEDLSSYVGKTLTMKILDCDKSHNKLVLSPKAVLLEEARQKKAETWASLEEGQVKDGVVRRLTSFGAFVDIGGVDGLLHVSEMAWYRVNHPSDVLKEGDEIKVVVLGVDRENEKISLGLKQLIANPWSLAAEKYPEGSVIDCQSDAHGSFWRFCSSGTWRGRIGPHFPISPSSGRKDGRCGTTWR